MSEEIILCGFKGCGKSTLAKAYAHKKGKKSLDTDDLIEDLYAQSFGKSLPCREIAAQDIRKFREIERQVIAHLTPQDADIFALGGGTLDDAKNIEHLARWKRKVYLYVAPHILWERILRQTALPAILDPHNPKGSFEKLFAKRNDCFYQYANEVINVGDAVPEELIGELR